MATAQARLSLDGASLPIVARIEHCSADKLVVGRRLPFLALGTRVADEAGRKGAISRVSLAVQEGIPYLSVELDYDQMEATRVRRDPTLGYETRASQPPPPTSYAHPDRSDLDHTNHDATLDLALALTPAQPVDPRGFVPSLYPMPLAIPEAPAVVRQGQKRAGRVVLAFLAALAGMLVAWIRPFSF